MIGLEELARTDPARIGRRIRSVGLILEHGNGKFLALRGGRVAEFNGVNSLKSLPAGVWLSNLDAGRAVEAGNSLAGGLVLPDGWIGISCVGMALEWGLQSCGLVQTSLQLEKLGNRIIGLSRDSVVRVRRRRKAGSDPSEDALTSQPSLAAGLGLPLQDWLGRDLPVECKLVDATRDICLVQPERSIPELKNLSGFRKFRAHLPRFSYALSLAKRPIPAAGEWRIVSRLKHTPGGQDPIGKLKRLDRPVIVAGFPSLDRPPSDTWLKTWMTGRPGVYGRKYFTLDEAEEIQLHGSFVVQEAYSGPGWNRRKTDSLLYDCISRLRAIAGGSFVVNNSWSAGMAAANLVHAIMHPETGNRKVHPLASAFISAYDRIAMVPAVSFAEMKGAKVVKATAGTIDYIVPDDDKVATEIANLLWLHGCTVPGMSSVAGRGPVGGKFDTEILGGDGRARLYAEAIQKHDYKILWKVDCVVGERVTIRHEMAECVEEQILNSPSIH